jgi:hypothetical protein
VCHDPEVDQRYPKSALSHVPPRNGLTVRERSGGTRMQTRTYIHGICIEICDRQIPGSQAPGKRRCGRARRSGNTRITTLIRRGAFRRDYQLCAPTVLLARYRSFCCRSAINRGRRFNSAIQLGNWWIRCASWLLPRYDRATPGRAPSRIDLRFPPPVLRHSASRWRQRLQRPDSRNRLRARCVR